MKCTKFNYRVVLFKYNENFDLFTENISAAVFDEPFLVNISSRTVLLSCKDIDENITAQWASGSYHYNPGIWGFSSSFLFYFFH